jgi:hypothetical protein
MAAQPQNVRVTYRVGATIPLGDNTFTNIKPEFEISADVPNGTNPKEVKDRLVAVADAWIEEKFNEVGKKTVAKV